MLFRSNRGKELANIFQIDFFDDLLQEIQDLYIKTGYLLHSSNRLTYPTFRCGSSDNQVFLTRGQLPWEVDKMSGLGTLASVGNNSEMISWEEMFDIEPTPILDWFAEFENTVRWSDCYQLPQNVKYLNIKGKSAYGYWQNNIDDNSLILCRENDNSASRQYWLLDLSEHMAIYKIPEWKVNDKEYLRIALALRVKARNYPSIQVQQMGTISKVKIDYLLPPAEQNFFELYSWPDFELYNCSDIKKSKWNRIVYQDVWPYFEIMFSRLGFQIIDKENKEK